MIVINQSSFWRKIVSVRHETYCADFYEMGSIHDMRFIR